nr:GDSL-type esterase/lipase family protein [Prevotella sp. 10(H)]
MLILVETFSQTYIPFKEGDRWCAIGNSITHQGKYLEMIYLYYITRFPTQQFKLLNCGAGGDTTTGTLTRRMDGDILVHQPTISTIMLGMNDIWWENSGLFTKENYSRDLEGIINRLEENGSRVILITPSPYDYSVKSTERVDPKRLGLERLASQVIDLGRKRNLPVVDFYNPMHQITLEQQTIDSTFTLLTKDRVHTTPLADFLMGYIFIKSTNGTPFVSKTKIDAKSFSVREQNNCSVSNLSFKDGTISFSLLEYALPYPKVAIPEEASLFMDFENELNQEILQIDGLTPGKYTLSINSIAIADYEAAEFAKGLNLATIADTPQNKQAALLAETIAEYTSIVGNIRYIAMKEYGELKKRYEIDDVSTPKADILEQFQGNTDSFNEYFNLKSKESFWMKKADELDKMLWENNKPQDNYYTIKKVK